VGLKLKSTRLQLVYTDVVNLMGDIIDTIKKDTETLIDASNEVDQEVNTEKAKCVLMSHHQNAEQNHNIMIVTDQNLLYEEINSRLNLE
jgi:hypothetical protein